MTLVLPGAVSSTPGSGARPIAVRVEKLHKRFPVRRGWIDTLRHPRRIQYATALEEVSLQIAEGELFGLLGPNGAGKTTLFKILSTLVLPDGGHASVAGFDVATHDLEVRRLLAPVVADERSLMWRLSARENLRMYGALQGLRGADLRDRIEELLSVVELHDAEDKMVGKFSSGMKQRLLIARALLARPRVLMLDEPTRSLDPVSARRFRTFLREEIADRQGCTILLATHSPEEALELCDRVGILNRGRLLRVGSPQQLLAEMGDEAYRIWIRPADERKLTALVDRGRLGSAVRVSDEEDGWVTVQVTIGGGAERAAKIVSDLVRDNVQIARFEPVRLTLADLIERIVGEHTEEALHA